MARFFKRNPNGSFDLRSLAEATYDLKDTISEIIEKNNFSEHKISLLGYSNGANLIVNYLKEIDNAPVDYVHLYHPSPGRIELEFKPQNNLKVLMTSGKNDPFISEVEFETLKNQLIDKQIDFVTYTHNNGHTLLQEELEASKNLIK